MPTVQKGSYCIQVAVNIAQRVNTSLTACLNGFLGVVLNSMPKLFLNGGIKSKP